MPSSPQDTATINTRNTFPFVIDVDSPLSSVDPISIGGLKLDDPNATLRPTFLNQTINVTNGTINLLRGNLAQRRQGPMEFGIQSGALNVGTSTNLTGPARFVATGQESEFNAFDGELAKERTLVVRGFGGANQSPGQLFVQNGQLTNKGTIQLDSVAQGMASLFINDGLGKLFNDGTVETGRTGLTTGSGGPPLNIFAKTTFNNGTIDLTDNGAGQLRFEGDLVQRPDGLLNLELGGPANGSFDTLTVTGKTSLAGTMDLQFINQFVPKIGQTLPLIHSANGIIGGFDLVGDLLEFLGEGPGLHLDYTDAQQVILFALTCGDADGDGGLFIDNLDLQEILTHWNALLAAGALPDLTGDGRVGIEDLNKVLANFVKGAAPVPEPASLCLLLTAIAVGRRRRR